MGDPFDSILNLEEQFIKEGEKDGTIDGKRNAETEGYSAGFNFGWEIAEEIGYYAGCTEGWICLSETTKKIPPRTKKVLLTLKQVIKELHLDPENQNVTEQMDTIRNKFKLVTTQLGVANKYSHKSLNMQDQHDDLSF
eukprot:TRINITY_DN1673_c0_g1_i1.p3 TRINITY_DN1673_c0_g1~~TRINITY_DN1673_c0_g1_i1.p3  ORF type:complete len:138 (+),score=12.36 TRINITY_DN1673_c0_g1_i1:25-438(+)